MNRNLLAVFFAIWSVSGYAQTINYEAKVSGMVCAYCAYSVSKNIGSLADVTAESIDVDLKSGRVVFQSPKPITHDELKSAVTQAGFSLVGLIEVETAPKTSAAKASVPAVDMKLEGLAPAQYQPLLEAVGQLAAGNGSRVVLRAPQALEDDLLKPVLMGRQQAVKLRFVPSTTNTVHLQLFLASTGNP